MKNITRLLQLLIILASSIPSVIAQSADVSPCQSKKSVPSSKAQFDLQFEWPVGVGGGEVGIETDGNYIYTTKWNGSDFYRYGMDGTYIESFTCGTASAVRDLAYSGTYFYGGAAATTVFEMDFTAQTTVSTFTAPTACRAIAYNEDDGYFYANNWGTPITAFTLTGANMGSFPVGPTGDSYYGFAYESPSYAGNGPFLWGYAQVGTTLNELIQISLPEGTETGVYFDVGSILSANDIAGGMCIDNNLVSGYWTIMGTCQNVNIWGVELAPSGPLPTIDAGVQSIVAPNSGMGLGTAEAVTIKVKNFGTSPISNVAVWFTMDGGAQVNETVSTTINGGDTYDHTFATTVDLSATGSYVFQACTDYPGDENGDNDCANKTVVNSTPAYCPASTTTEDECIGNVLCGSIDNTTGWQGGVGDYTAQSTSIDAGSSEAIFVTSGCNILASDAVSAWVDWNANFVFDVGGNEEFILTNVGSSGIIYTGNIAVPAGTPEGDYRMRVRMVYIAVPDPCGNSSYGEVEDYTITVGQGVFLEPPTNFMAEVQNDVNVYCTWTAPTGGGEGEWIQWDAGINTGNGIGLTNGGTFYVASHWMPAELAPYDGQEITMISIFANGDSAATYTLMAWTGPNAGTQIMSQAVGSFTVNKFNEISLSTPITIDASDELWFGYGVTHSAGTLPAGCDDGPAIAFSGDMISLDNITWVSMSTVYGLNYNWNLAACLEESDGSPAQLMVKKVNQNVSSGSFVTNESVNFSKKFNPSVSKALLGYNVYRKGDMIGYTAVTNYLDENLPCGTYTYYVTAVYDEGESGPSLAPNVLLVCIEADLTVLLEGPYSDENMLTGLNSKDLIPLTQPFNVWPWFYDGIESVADIPSPDIIDWILVELRETPGDASLATPRKIIAQKAGFLRKDGKIVEADASANNPLTFNVSVVENLFAVIWHRNHLGIMSAQPLTNIEDTFYYNFSSGENQVLGGLLGHKQLAPDKWGMVSGDGNADGFIDLNDKTDIWMVQAGNEGYNSGDYNLDGQVNNPDKNEFWLPNIGKSEMVTDCPPFPISNAGPDQTGVCAPTALEANTPLNGTGLWTIIYGIGGMIDYPFDPVSSFTGINGNSYILKWSISTICDTAFDEVAISFLDSPYAANAGPDQTDACSPTILHANNPSVGNGMWSIVDGIGGIIDDPLNRHSSFAGVYSNTYILRWTISTICDTIYDDVVISFVENPIPDAADAGPDKINVYSPIILAANTPSNGTGIWSIIDGVGGGINDPFDPESSFGGMGGDTYILRWTIYMCSDSSYDDVSIVFNPTFSCGQGFFDTRDGRVYNTVNIGDQCWFAKNINIGIQIDGAVNQQNNSIIEKYCYANDENNCNVSGGLYQWNEMMQYSTMSGVQGVCPDGWHIPDDDEWCMVTEHIDPSVNCNNIGWSGTNVGSKMKSTSGWSGGCNANNNSGFTALPGGHRTYVGNFTSGSNTTYFWSSSMNISNTAWYRLLECNETEIHRNNFERARGLSVRCVKDSGPQ